jgi:hypothetical protein
MGVCRLLCEGTVAEYVNVNDEGDAILLHEDGYFKTRFRLDLLDDCFSMRMGNVDCVEVTGVDGNALEASCFL